MPSQIGTCFGAILFLTMSPAATAGENAVGDLSPHYVSVQGRSTPEGYRLSLEYFGEIGAETLAAIVIRAEPSERVLLVHENAIVSEKVRASLGLPSDALSYTSGPFGASQPTSGIVFDPGRDNGVSVSLVSESGGTTSITSSPVDLTNFAFRTKDIDRTLLLAPEETWVNCCRCSLKSGCGTALHCEDCDTPWFYCDCIGCNWVICCGNPPSPCPP